MADGSTLIKEIKLDEMAQLRDTSQKIAATLLKELEGHLKTLTPLFSPRKVLGEFMQSASRDKVVGAEKNFSALEENYKAIMRDGFDLSAKLSTPLPAIANKLEVYPWCYLDEVGGAKGTISFRSPVRWVLTYACSHDLSWLLEARMKGEAVSYEGVSPFVINSLTMWLLLGSSPGLKRLLEALGYRLSIEKQPGVAGDLPLVVLSSALPAFRPQDDLVKMVSQLSGAASFEEIVDIDSLEGMDDPFKRKIQALTAG